MVQPTRIVSCAVATDTHALANSSAATIRFMVIPLRRLVCRRWRYGTTAKERTQASEGGQSEACPPSRVAAGTSLRSFARLPLPRKLDRLAHRQFGPAPPQLSILRNDRADLLGSDRTPRVPPIVQPVHEDW